MIVHSLELEMDIEADIQSANLIMSTVRKLGYDIEEFFDISVSNMEEIKEELRIEALKDAKRKAESMAAVIGEKVVGMDRAGELSNEYFSEEDCEEWGESRCIAHRKAVDNDTPMADMLSIKRITETEDIKVVWLTEKVEID